jgi:hypothetical protein
MLSFVAFLGLFLFVVRNKAVPRFIRFNTMQVTLPHLLSPNPFLMNRPERSNIPERLAVPPRHGGRARRARADPCGRVAAPQALLLEILLIFPQILTSSNMGGFAPPRPAFRYNG